MFMLILAVDVGRDIKVDADFVKVGVEGDVDEKLLFTACLC